MKAYLEIQAASGRRVVVLEGHRLAIGKAPDNDVVLDGDESVSRLHAVLERYPSGWSIRDLGSRNGTSVNGERMVAERALRDADEILIGQTRLVFQTELTSDRGTATK